MPYRETVRFELKPRDLASLCYDISQEILQIIVDNREDTTNSGKLYYT